MTNPELLEDDEKKADPSGASDDGGRKGSRSSNANSRMRFDQQGRNPIEQKMYAQIRKRCLPILRNLISFTIPETKITNNGAIRRAASESLIKVNPFEQSISFSHTSAHTHIH